MILQWTLRWKYVFCLVLLFSLGRYPEVIFLGCAAVLVLTFCGPSIVPVPTYSYTRSRQGFPFLHTLTSVRVFSSPLLRPTLAGPRWRPLLVLTRVSPISGWSVRFGAGAVLCWLPYLCGIIWSQGMWYFGFVLLSQDCFGYSGHLCFHTNCRIACFSSVKSAIGILIRTTLDL